jgi:hypothetical protein
MRELADADGAQTVVRRVVGSTAVLVTVLVVTTALWMLTGLGVMIECAFEDEAPAPPPASVLPDVDGFTRQSDQRCTGSSCSERTVYFDIDGQRAGQEAPSRMLSALRDTGWAASSSETVTKGVVVASVRVADHPGEHADVAVALSFTSEQAARDYHESDLGWWPWLVGVMTLLSGALIVSRAARRRRDRAALISSGA